MANTYRTFGASTEQNLLSRLSAYLQFVGGWYLNYNHSDGSTDRQYTFVSEGDESGCPTIYANIRAYINHLYLVMYQYENAQTGVSSGYTLTYSNLLLPSVGVPGRCRVWANKKRFVLMVESSATERKSMYMGLIDTFYEYADDPWPAMVIGNSSDHWTDTTYSRMLRPVDNTVVEYSLSTGSPYLAEGYPNGRSGEYTFHKPFVYYSEYAPSYEIRGRLSGIYLGEELYLGHGSVVDIDNAKYMAIKNTDEADCVLVGPLSDNGTVPFSITQGGFPNQPDHSVDYTVRGFEYEKGGTGTLALWRFDTDNVDYVRSSGEAYGVPAVFSDTANNFDLSPQNSVTVGRSWLQEAAVFNGSTQYATVSGSTAAVTALSGEWTVELLFKPDTIPGAGTATLLEYSVGASAAEVDNTHLSISIAPIVGTSPDEFDRGNITVTWEKGAGTEVSSTSASDFVFAERWNYLAIVKKSNGVNYDVEVWHCSFGDYCTPYRKAILQNMDNTTGGTNGYWFVGSNADMDAYFDGMVDDTRVTKRALTQAEIEVSCSRVVL